jgi:hypothetical protein
MHRLAERLAREAAHVEVHKSRRMQGFAWHVMDKTVLLGRYWQTQLLLQQK